MVNIHRLSVPSVPLHRPKYFGAGRWMFYVLVGLVALLLGLAVSQTSLEGRSYKAKEVDVALVQSRVVSLADSWDLSNDPLVEIEKGLMAKRSNVEGFAVEGVRYYYSMTNAPSFDPVSLGKAKEYEVVSIIDQYTPWEIVIYRLKN